MFLSAQSFADLEGKALLCKFERSISGYTFLSNYNFQWYYVGLKNDTYSVNISPLHGYSIEPDWIRIFMGIKINRKTLRIFDIKGEDFGQCELYDSKTIRARMEEHRNERQKIYNKSFEGNKL